MGAPKLIVVSAPSGAGKTTLCQMLLRDFPDRLVLSISSTTRPPRGDERNGREYFFLSREEFERSIREGRFAEWARVHSHFYGTSKEVIERSFSEGKSVLLDIDVQGAMSLARAYPGSCHRIFIVPPDMATLEGRLRSRGTESEDAIQRRLENARAELARREEFDRTVVNDTLDRAYLELKRIIEDLLVV